MKTKYLKSNQIKALAKAEGKRVSAEFLINLDKDVEEKIITVCKTDPNTKKI